MRKLFFLVLIFAGFLNAGAQDVQLFRQFGGHIDFTMIGNTLNNQENNTSTDCSINTQSSATLNLSSVQTVRAAFLYWAGSGSGDLEIILNNTTINAERTFSDFVSISSDPSQTSEFFSAFADVTDQIIAEGNTTYTVSELDLSPISSDHCNRSTNFGGWGIVIIYEENTLPLNQINVYDGLEHVPDAITIQLNNLNVIDNAGAKIGFVAWEGDETLSVSETLSVNGNIISNPPLNPANNAFNSTNSFTNQSNLYNMDLDSYNIQNNISIGDTSATVSLTSGQDVVLINTIITTLNSQLPDATATIDQVLITNCNDRIVDVHFSIHNQNSTDVLPANTPISVYINNTLTASLTTQNEIPINGYESQIYTLTIPEDVLPDFDIRIVVDEPNDILESAENNNAVSYTVNYPLTPQVTVLEGLTACDKGFDTSDFDLTGTADFLSQNYPSDITFTWYPSEEDLMNDTNEIDPSFTYTNASGQQSIFIKAAEPTSGCFSINILPLEIENCPPTVYNLFSPNGDGVNEEFTIEGLKNIFTEYELLVYNRYGSLVYKGNNNTPNWKGTHLNTGKKLPEGTYFYSLNFHDNKNKPLTGWVYLNR